MVLTAEQDAIVNAGDVDIAVSAGAGTGKTHVLVERYVTLLDRNAIPEIVAVTFTDAAAAEMRRRVRREVLTRPTLEHHRAFVDDAVIGTIHSLCLRILREHPVEAGIDPGIQVLSEDEAELLRREACTTAIDAAAERGGAATEALGTIGVYQTTLMLVAMVQSRDEVRESFAALPDDVNGITTHIRARLDASCDAILTPLKQSLPAALATVRLDMQETDDRLAQSLLTAEAALAAAIDGDFARWAEGLQAARESIVLTGGKKAAWVIDVVDVRAGLKAVRDAIDLALKEAVQWNEADAICAATLPGLRVLFEDACTRYEAAKHERVGFDFLDLELAAVALLDGYSTVAEHYHRHWRHLMVDESQDVSRIQARLIRLLLGDGEGGPRLFLVGDEKQSIYRFRGARVTEFRELRELVRARGGNVLSLSGSFRTHPELIERINDLFEFLFDVGEVSMERMTGRPSESPEGPHVVVMPITTVRNQHLQRLTEADLVGIEIRSLLDGGRLVWDRVSATYRAVRAGDIAILLRRFENVHIFEQALEARNVSFATPSGTGFFTRQEILDLSNLLRWLHEPDDQIALVGVLRSPLFILRDDTLLALRANGRPLVLALNDPPEGLEPDERSRCLFAADVLRVLRRSARTASAADLLEEALALTGFEASWAPLTGGEQALANIRKLARLCRDLSGYTLGEVVEYLGHRRDDLVAREGPAVLDRPNAVQIMTVHGAKGLEFPVVFLPEAHLAPFVSSDAVKWRAGDGISFTLERGEDDETRPRPAFYSWLQRLESSDEDEEHLRLFYVAATRAADYLYLSGDLTGDRGWMPKLGQATDEGTLDQVSMRPAVTPDIIQMARRPAPQTVAVPPAETEVEFMPDLLRRGPIIPIRTSTAATAIRIETHMRGGHGDGLGLIRGRIVHRAIERRYTRPHRDDSFIDEIVAEEAADVGAAACATLAVETREMLKRFSESPTGLALAEPGVSALFEVPFAWDWDGIPVHGQIDLLYRSPVTARWHVIDFKTDRVNSGHEAEAAAPYLVQLGLYASAIEAATGERPETGLAFLRSGTLYGPAWADLEAAMAVARSQVNAGLTLDPESPEYLTEEG